jgi:hypothetical protein
VIDQVPLKSKLESLRLEVVVLFLTLKGWRNIYEILYCTVLYVVGRMALYCPTMSWYS